MPKQRNTPSARRNRYAAEEILGLLADQNGPVSWREMVAIAQAYTPKDITQLRQMLKGLIRSGDLARDHQGAYHLVEDGGSLQTLVERKGRDLFANGLPIEESKRFALRAGDAVEYREVEGVARVLKVISHSDELVTGVLVRDGKQLCVEALGMFKGKIALLEVPRDVGLGDTVHVRIIDRDRRGLVGEIESALQHESVLDQAIDTALATGHIPHTWPSAVLEAAERLPKSVHAKAHSARVDLTELPLVTIDGETAQDFDDAVFAQVLPDTQPGFRLVVAIADVGHYVKRGSVLDVEALERCTSVYFPQRVVPMLPEAISNGLCSLRPQTPRLTLVCDMQVSPKGEVVKHEFYEAVIYSHARLTYNEVQTFLDAGVDAANDLPVEKQFASEVVASIKCLHKVYTCLRQARERRGALDFETTEAELKLVEGRVVAIQEVVRVEAHQLIEEAMIAANVCAAQFLEDNDTPALYRVHEIPDPDKVEELRQALSYVGVRLASGEVAPLALQNALRSLPDTADKRLYAQLALRSLKQAVYSPRNQGHYGLALQRYMHFTSPIRRYPDLAVHRAIKAVLARQQGKKPQALPNMDQLVSLGEQCSAYERRAETAGWLVDAWLKCDFLQDQVGNQMAGVIAGVTEFGLFVELNNYFVQGLLHISNLGQDYYRYDARRMALVGERSGERFMLGEKLDVLIVDIDPPQGRIDLMLPQNKKHTHDQPNKKSQKKSSKPSNKSSSKKSGRRRKSTKGSRA